MIKISSIIPNPHNPRFIKDDKFKKLCENIKALPEGLALRPIVVDENNVVLGGNMRLKALIELGYKEVPDDWVKPASGFTPEQIKRFIITDNVGYGEWDWDMIASDWDVDELKDWGMDIPDFAVKEVDAEEDDYEVPETIETDIVIGDLFEIGQHRLLCGDSTQTDTFDKLFQGDLADLVITDPPYNVSYTGKTKDALTIENDSMGDSDFYQFLYDFYTALNAYLKPGGVWYVWQPDKYINVFINSFIDAGIKYSSLNVWVKNSLVLGRGDYHSKHETCIYGWKEGAAHNWYSDRKQTTVLEFDRPQRNAEHPTMKPIPLFAYQIQNSSKQGDIVADGFAGSGTTMVTCHQTGRKAYVVEYDPKYCQVIVDRMLKLDPNIKIKRNGQIYKPAKDRDSAS